MTPRELEGRLLHILEERYHERHPFNLRMHAGTLTPREIRSWVRNRYYYQTRIPIKDGLILAKAEDPAFRRTWIRRIHDHDDPAGGLELWLRLAEAVGLAPEQVASLRNVLPGVRRACDAYVDFVSSHDLLESVAASLTELRAGGLMGQRIAVFERHYPWVDSAGLAYFRTRSAQAPRDAHEGLSFVLKRAVTPGDRERCVSALSRKCEILWSLLDAVEWAAKRPRLSAAAKLELRPGEALVVLPERAVRLNETGREVLSLCDGARSIDEIAETLRGRHPEPADLESGVYGFLEEMERQGVLEPAP